MREGILKTLGRRVSDIELSVLDDEEGCENWSNHNSSNSKFAPGSFRVLLAVVNDVDDKTKVKAASADSSRYVILNIKLVIVSLSC